MGAYILIRKQSMSKMILVLSFAVQSPPLIVKQPPSDEILFQVAQRQDENDKPFVIECEAEGEPAPKSVFQLQSNSLYFFC